MERFKHRGLSAIVGPNDEIDAAEAGHVELVEPSVAFDMD
jgi:hypothetical protein